MSGRWGRLVLGLLALSAIAGCSRFTTTRKIDTGPFAENTVTMVGEVQRLNRTPEWSHLLPYRDRPSVLAAREAAVPMRNLLKGVALYSTQLVSLQESSLPESRKVQELASYIDEVSRPGVMAHETEDIGITVARLDSIVAEVRRQETFMAALTAAQPLVVSVTVYGNKLFNASDDAVRAAVTDLEGEIEQKFAPMRANLMEMQGHHTRLVHNFGQLYRVRFGDAAAFDSLLESNPGLVELAPKGRRPTGKDLDAIEEKLAAELNQVEAVRAQLLPEFTLYREYQAELNMLRDQTEDLLRLGRATLNLWSRSHRNLAAGIAVPPSIDVVGLFRSTAQSAAGKLPGM
jgi:hypothetical protein